jgi:hypothetical protein
MTIGEPVSLVFPAGMLTGDPFEKVYADRTYGQSEEGWMVGYNADDPDGAVFVSYDGTVYQHGTDRAIGRCPEQEREYEGLCANYEIRYEQRYYG